MFVVAIRARYHPNKGGGSQTNQVSGRSPVIVPRFQSFALLHAVPMMFAKTLGGGRGQPKLNHVLLVRLSFYKIRIYLVGVNTKFTIV